LVIISFDPLAEWRKARAGVHQSLLERISRKDASQSLAANVDWTKTSSERREGGISSSPSSNEKAELSGRPEEYETTDDEKHTHKEKKHSASEITVPILTTPAEPKQHESPGAESGSSWGLSPINSPDAGASSPAAGAESSAAVAENTAKQIRPKRRGSSSSSSGSLYSGASHVLNAPREVSAAPPAGEFYGSDDDSSPDAGASPAAVAGSSGGGPSAPEDILKHFRSKRPRASSSSSGSTYSGASNILNAQREISAAPPAGAFYESDDDDDEMSVAAGKRHAPSPEPEAKRLRIGGSRHDRTAGKAGGPSSALAAATTPMELSDEGDNASERDSNISRPSRSAKPIKTAMQSGASASTDLYPYINVEDSVEAKIFHRRALGFKAGLEQMNREYDASMAGVEVEAEAPTAQKGGGGGQGEGEGQIEGPVMTDEEEDAVNKATLLGL
jgi:hypothetical protein